MDVDSKYTNLPRISRRAINADNPISPKSPANPKWVSHLPCSDDLWATHIGRYLSLEQVIRLKLASFQLNKLITYQKICERYNRSFKQMDDAILLQNATKFHTFCKHVNFLKLKSYEGKMIVDPKLGAIALHESSKVAICSRHGELTLWDTFSGQHKDFRVTTDSSRIQLLANAVYKGQTCLLLQIAKSQLEIWSLADDRLSSIWEEQPEAMPTRASLIPFDDSLYHITSTTNQKKPTEIECLQPDKNNTTLVRKWKVAHNSPIDDALLLLGKHMALFSTQKIEFINLKDNEETLPELDWSIDDDNGLRYKCAWENRVHWICYSNKTNLFFNYLDVTDKVHPNNQSAWNRAFVLSDIVLRAKVIACPMFSKLFWAVWFKEKGFRLRMFDMKSTQSIVEKLISIDLPIKKSCLISGLVRVNLGLRDLLCLLFERELCYKGIQKKVQKYSVVFVDPESHLAMHATPITLFRAFGVKQYWVHRFEAVKKGSESALSLILQNRETGKFRYVSAPLSEFTIDQTKLQQHYKKASQAVPKLAKK